MTKRRAQDETIGEDDANVHNTSARDHDELLEATDAVLEFRCNDCGDCCGGWSIGADRGFQATLEDRLDRFAPEHALDDFVGPPAADSVQQDPVLRTHSGRCVFHAGGGCSLHSHFGPESKPVACQTYPYRQVRLPGVTSLSLDLSCRTASELLARPFEPSVVEHQRLLEGLEPSATELIDGLPLDATVYFEIERALFETLATPRASVEDRLLAGSLLIDEVVAVIDSDDGREAAPEDWLAAFRIGRADMMRNLIRQARAHVNGGMRQYFLMARLVDLVEQWLNTFDIDRGTPFWQETRRAMERLDVDAETEGWDERAGRCLTTIADCMDNAGPGVEDVFANYVWQLAMARHLQVEYGLALGYRVLVVHYTLARLHAVALALAEGTGVELRHATRAVQLVERNFGHLPLLRRFWRRTSIMNLLLAPDFAPRMLLLPEESVEDERAA